MSVKNTPFVQDALTGRRVTPIWLAYVLVFLVAIIGVQGAVGAVFESSWKVTPGTPTAQLQEAISFAAALALLLLWVVLFERRRVATLGFRGPGRGVLTMLGGIVVGIVLLSIPTLFLLAIGAYEVVDAPAGATSGWSALPLLLLLACFVLVQGGTEEVLVRGFLLQNNGLKLPGWVAVLVPSFVFTLIHGVLTKPLALSMILLYALMASFLVLRLGSLWLVIGIHAGWNFAMGNLYGVAVSGLEPHTTSAVFLRAADDAPAWLTGGEFGTEASLPAVVVLLVAAALAFASYRRWDRRRAALPPEAPVVHRIA